jgi:hypothetical protein
MIGIEDNGTWSRVLRLSRLLVAASLGLAAVGPLACSSDDKCDGVEIDGKCQKACEPGACPVEGSLCFDNACAKPCPTGISQCEKGTWCATLAYEGQQRNHCVQYPFARSGKTGQNEACSSNDQCDVHRGFTCPEGGGSCTRPCAGHSDCDIAGGQACDGQKCVEDGSKRYEPCTGNAECAAGAGYSCVAGECRLLCMTHGDCVAVGECKPGKDALGKDVLACEKGTPPAAGQFNSPCPLAPAPLSCTSDDQCADSGRICAKDADGRGRCASECSSEDRSQCAASEHCLAEADGRTICSECDIGAGFFCASAGPGDITGYCTQRDCQSSADCGLGYHCETVRSGQPCTATCDLPASSATTCIKSEDIGPGKKYSCGPISLHRKVCLKNSFCNECESDADCRSNPNQICAADAAGQKICTIRCDPNTNSCPWGNAGKCGDWDGDGVFTCAHKFSGGCKGSGGSCEPCRDDADCPTGICYQTNFTAERFCVDLSVSCSCDGLKIDDTGQYCGGGGCPKSPGGLTMSCFNGPEIDADSVIFQKCFGANAGGLGSTQTGCWPAN